MVGMGVGRRRALASQSERALSAAPDDRWSS